MSEQVSPNETTVPVLPCTTPTETLEFFQALGFRATYRQTRPYLYLALTWSGFDLHFGDPPKRLEPGQETGITCLVMVDAVAPYHAAFTEAMRRAYGKVLVRDRPRLTRCRPGASRFTLVDPSGNSIVFIRRDEEQDLEYGGSKRLKGIARALDNARILREFKNDDRAAERALTLALRRYGDTAPAVDRVLALAALLELAVALDEPDRAEEWTAQLRAIDLSDADRQRVEGEVANVDRLRRWLA
ncbi:glyoxalase [Micromonospora cathayae]|uniref:Glyoxalase n=1 Tax=Micromonospora cathayae TaxID=3028804 RepID=A0ABY7ZV93_9ACTN|nr:glyoxalase [Micromonospora sp. HUAS 3]WDZ86321.1 glyoxalase [Micromonospora sp. HUAS 3]